MCSPLDSPNDDFVPANSAIDANYALLTEIDLPMCRSSIFGVSKSLLVPSPKVMYNVEDIKDDDTHIQVIMNSYLFMYLFTYDHSVIASSIQEFELDSWLFVDDIFNVF